MNCCGRFEDTLPELVYTERLIGLEQICFTTCVQNAEGDF
jgi:hypothetical protein